MSVTLTERPKQAKPVVSLSALFVLSFSGSSLWLWHDGLQRDVVAPMATRVSVSAEPPLAVHAGAPADDLPVNPGPAGSLAAPEDDRGSGPTLHELVRDPDPAIQGEAVALLALLTEEESS